MFVFGELTNLMDKRIFGCSKWHTLITSRCLLSFLLTDFQNKFLLTYVISINSFQSDHANETNQWVEGLLNGEMIRILPNGMAMKVQEFEHVRFANFVCYFTKALECFGTLLRRRPLIQTTFWYFPHFTSVSLKLHRNHLVKERVRL